MKRTALLLAVALCFAIAAEETPPNPNEQDPMIVFEKRYNAGSQAVLDKNWIDAQRHFEVALAALGQRDNVKKQVAQILLKKAQEEGKKQRALFTANELLRLNQFKEAEEAFLAAKVDLGDTEEIRQGLEAVRLRREREQDPKTRAMMDREREYALAIRETQNLIDARKFENARQYAERARVLKPDDARAMLLLHEIDRRIRGDRDAQDPERRGPPAEAPREKTGEF